MNFWIKDPKDGQPSVTLTVFMLGFAVATFKLLSSGFACCGMQFSPFTGTDFAAAVGAVGAIYFARRNVTIGDSSNGQS